MKSIILPTLNDRHALLFAKRQALFEQITNASYRRQYAKATSDSRLYDRRRDIVKMNEEYKNLSEEIERIENYSYEVIVKTGARNERAR
jgi:hypothetical protein